MSQSSLQHLCAVLNDQEISSDKLQRYRSSRPLFSSPKIGISTYFGLEGKNIGTNFTNRIFSSNQNTIQPLLKEVNPITQRNLVFCNKENVNVFSRTCNENNKVLGDLTNHKLHANLDQKDHYRNTDSKIEQNNKKYHSLNVSKCSPISYYSPDSNQPSHNTFENLIVPIIPPLQDKPIKIQTTSIGTDPLDFEPQDPVKTYSEQGMDTEGLVQLDDKLIGTETLLYEEKLIDTADLLVTHEKGVETGNEFMEVEKREFAEQCVRARNEETTIRLSKIQWELSELKQEHPKLKQDICGLFGQKENWTEFIQNSFKSYMSDKNADKKEKIMTLHSSLVDTKRELGQVKTEVTDIIQKTKEEMTQTFQFYLEIKLRQMLQTENSLRALNASKMNEMISENYSVSTESNFCSPSKPSGASLMDQSFDSQSYVQPTKYSKKNPKKVNKGIVDGMLYLLQNGAIKDSITDIEGFTQKMEELLMTKSKEKITSDLVFDNLMDKTRKKQVNFNELADKKERRRSTRNKDPAPVKKVHVEEKEAKKYPPVIMVIDLSKKV